VPAGGRAVPEVRQVWTCGWPAARVRSAGTARLRLAVVGTCGARAQELHAALEDVEAGRWRALTRWPGSYLVVAVRGHTTAVIGDLAGQHPVFWRPFEGGVWWSTAAIPLAALDGAAVDPVALASRLALGQPDLAGERALFHTVRRVPTGRVLLIGPQGAWTRRFEPDDYPAVPMAQGAAAVAGVLEQAVTSRLLGRPVVADLAGLDSTTLVCLAAARGVPVSAVTYADPRMRDDDLAYARRTAALVPGVRHRTVRGSEETVPYAGLEDPRSVPVTDAPSLYVVTAAVKRAILSSLDGEGHGAGVYFTGEGGDVVLSASAAYVADLYRAGRRLAAWRHAVVHARVRRLRPLVLWRRVGPLARDGLPGAWRRAAQALRAAPGPSAGVPPEAAARQVLSPVARWMSGDVRVALADRVEEQAGTIGAGPGLATWADRQDLARIGADMAGWQALTGRLELQAPYLDNEVIRACLSVEAFERGAADRYKPLLAAAFPHGPVPDFVLARTTKGGLDGVSHAGLRRHAATLGDLLGPSSLMASLGLLPPAGLREAVALAGAGQGQGAIHHAAVTELWLRQAAASRRWWTSARPAGTEGRHAAA
jgi:asparagine synthase (glutamine-hydrolysing)